MKLKSNRKFIVVMSILAICSVAILSGKLQSSDFANVMSSIGIAFMGGNAMEHWCKKGQGDGGD